MFRSGGVASYKINIAFNCTEPLQPHHTSAVTVTQVVTSTTYEWNVAHISRNACRLLQADGSVPVNWLWSRYLPSKSRCWETQKVMQMKHLG
jgi:hypothetical protein